MILESPQHFITVGKSNTEFASIQNAINSYNDQSTTNQYVIYVYPGTYEENITLKSYTHVVGVDKETCTIKTSDAAGMITMGANSSIRNFTLNKQGASAVPCVNINNKTEVIIKHCDIYPDNANAHGIYMVGGEAEIINCNITTASEIAIEIKDASGIIVHAEIRECYLITTAEDPLSFDIGYTPNNTATIYQNTLRGSGTNAISALISSPGTLLFKSAHNRMNKAIEGTITDLITTPYNVINVDV